MFPSSSPIPPSNDRDRAAVTTTSVLSIVLTSSSLAAARPQIEQLLRNELHDVARQTIADHKRDGDDAGGDQ